MSNLVFLKRKETIVKEVEPNDRGEWRASVLDTTTNKEIKTTYRFTEDEARAELDRLVRMLTFLNK